VSAPRWAPDPEVYRAAREVATSVLDLARRLGVNPQTLRRWARDTGEDLSELVASHTRRPPDLEPAEALDRDLELKSARERGEYWRRQYEQALGRIRQQDEIAATLAERYADPLPAPAFSSRPAKPAKGKRLPKREAILQLSDWQLGQLVRDVATGGTNEYSWAIAEKRLERWLDAAIGEIENKRQAYDVWRVVLAISGDMVEGHDVFSGQPWSLDRDAAVQAIDGSSIFAAAISELVRALGAKTVVDVYLVPGNHGKPGGRKGGATPPTFSFDVLLYEFLRLRLANHPLHEWGHEPAGRLLFMAAGVPVLMTHGDEVRGWGGFPYYGLDKAQGRLLQELDTIFHVWLLSHWHQAAVLPSGRGQRIVNGNAVGPNRLTTAAVLGATTPSQNLIYMSRDFGVSEIAFLQLAPGEIRRPRLYGEHAS